MIRIIQSTDTTEVDRLLRPRREDLRRASARVARIVEDVRENGDEAVRKYAARFDRLAGAFEIPRNQWRRASQRAPADVRTALRRAANHIAAVARAQVPKGRRVTVTPGV